VAKPEKTEPLPVCLDADVLIAGLLSRTGASHAILVLGELGLLRLSGREARSARSTLRSSTIIRGGREGIMARPAIHPGEQLAEELKALGMSAAELARQMQVPTNRVTEILHGQRALTGDTALRLGHFFGTSPEFWLNLQSLYELRLAEERVGKTVKNLPTLKRRKGRRQPAHA